MKNVLVLMPVEARHKEKIEAAGKGCSIVYSSPNQVTEEQIRSANVIFGNPKAAMIGASENLDWLQLESAGTDAYIVPGVLNAKTVLTNATGAYTKAVSEHAFALTLMLQKKLYLYRDEQKKAFWSDHGTVGSLSDCTVAVVGLGDIGQAYAKLVKAMGAYVIGVKRRATNPPECVDELAMTQELDTVLPRADVIMSVLPNTAATRYIYTAESFDKMKDSALFINCGRGKMWQKWSRSPPTARSGALRIWSSPRIFPAASICRRPLSASSISQPETLRLTSKGKNCATWWTLRQDIRNNKSFRVCPATEKNRPASRNPIRIRRGL